MIKELSVFFGFKYYPNVSEKANLGFNNIIVNPQNIYLYGNASLKRDSVIMNRNAKFIMKNNSGAAEELMIITGNICQL